MKEGRAEKKARPRIRAGAPLGKRVEIGLLCVGAEGVGGGYGAEAEGGEDDPAHAAQRHDGIVGLIHAEGIPHTQQHSGYNNDGNSEDPEEVLHRFYPPLGR